jgi:hypothetical protein
MTDDSPPIPRIGPALLAYIATTLGAVAVFQMFRPHGLALAFLIVVPAAALLWMVRQSMARRRAMGCGASPASRAYLRRFFPLMIGYALSLMLATWLAKHHMPASGPAAFALALLPALPLIGVIWSLGRLVVEEADEYQRMLHVRQMMIATGFMLVVTCTWGFLEEFGQVPHLPMYWAFILWCAGLAVGSFVNEVRS